MLELVVEYQPSLVNSEVLLPIAARMSNEDIAAEFEGLPGHREMANKPTAITKYLAESEKSIACDWKGVKIFVSAGVVTELYDGERRRPSSVSPSYFSSLL